MFTFILYFVFGLAALIISLISAREKRKPLIISGWILVGIMTLMVLTHLPFAQDLFADREFFVLVVLAAIYILPIVFLTQSLSQKTTTDALDGSAASGAVTEEFLDEVINSPDEEINFEDELDLK